MSLLLVAITRYAPNTQNSNFAKSLQYLKKEGRDEIDFLHAANHQTSLQFDAIKSWWARLAMAKVPKITSLQ